MRRHEEDIGVADVVGPRERQVGCIEQEQEHAAPRPAPQHRAEADGRERDARHADLLAQIEPVHGGAALEAHLGNRIHQRFAPILLRHVKPEFPNRLDECGGGLEVCPQAPEIPRVLEGPERGDGDGQRQHPRPQGIGCARTPMHQEKNCKGGHQENHAQMVAEPQSEHGIEQGQTPQRGPIGPRHEREPGRADHHQVERVDLGGDGLAPVGIGKREKQPGADAGDERLAQPRGKHCREPDCNRAISRRREVHRARRLTGMEPDEEVSETVIERVGLPRVQRQRAGDRLERRAIAEIEAGNERSVVAQERDDRETRGD